MTGRIYDWIITEIDTDENGDVCTTLRYFRGTNEETREILMRLLRKNRAEYEAMYGTYVDGTESIDDIAAWRMLTWLNGEKAERLVGYNQYQYKARVEFVAIRRDCVAPVTLLD